MDAYDVGAYCVWPRSPIDPHSGLSYWGRYCAWPRQSPTAPTPYHPSSAQYRGDRLDGPYVGRIAQVDISDLIGRRDRNIAANIARDKANRTPPAAQAVNNRRNRDDDEDHLMVVELFTNAAGRHGGIRFSRIDTSGMSRSKRRRLERRIRSINERRLQTLAAANPNAALMQEVRDLMARIEYLESR